jgi:5'-nucleotidase
MMKRFSTRLFFVAASLAAGVGSASAQTTTCSGTLAAGTYANVDVPVNATCQLSIRDTVTVTGNVRVERGATLLVGNATFVVNGSLIGVDAARIDINEFTGGTVNILGSVHLTGTTSDAELVRLSIGGTLSIANSTADILVALNNVAGSVLLRGNIGGRFFFIHFNAIGGSLVCTDNTPPPDDEGQPNTVGGNVGQCEGL